MVLGDKRIKTRGVRHWYLNQHEVDAMCELMTAGHPYAALIYQLELRTNMDYATYTVGITRRLSERGVLELVERDPENGSRWAKKKRDRNWVQRQFRILIKFGLIEKIPKKQMCYRLLLANVDLFRAQEERTLSDSKERTLSGGAKQVGKPANLRIVACNNTQKRLRSERKNEVKTMEERTTSEKVFTTTTGSDDLPVSDEPDQPFTFEQLRAVDMAMVADAYHAVLPGMRVVRFPDTPGYRLMVAHIWYGAADGKHQSVDFWRWYFEQCKESDFLMGRAFDQRRGKFKVSFKYLLERDVFIKIMNGEYS